jgi:SAM-dependent methyltransferase
MIVRVQDHVDQSTADAFATSWNNLPAGSVYTREQFEDWLNPLTQADIADRSVLEMGCGNGSLLVHMANWRPAYLEGVDLGDSVLSATRNLSTVAFKNWEIRKHDLTTYQSDGFDVVYCIGVLHHLKDPKTGFDAVVRNVKPGGRFHCWVYAKEGNAVVRYVVDPLRKVACRLPWWVTKHGIATPLAVPFYIYAKTLRAFSGLPLAKRLPLFDYSRWIAQREFAFFRHVAFDQLVTPQTTYLDRHTIEAWLRNHPRIDPRSAYIQMRNGNSWKFGGEVR